MKCKTGNASFLLVLACAHLAMQISISLLWHQRQFVHFLMACDHMGGYRTVLEGRGDFSLYENM